jgi:ATP-dependent RNA helicase DeaD
MTNQHADAPTQKVRAAAAGEDPSAGFAAFSLDDRLLATLDALGYEEPTPVQRQVIPALIAGRDVLAEAPTGTGKTAAFALPLLQRFAGQHGAQRARREGGIGGLVLAPTRELAVQVSEAIHRYGENTGVRVVPIYGGQAISLQLRALRRGVEIVVATPGRAVDHVNRGSMRLDSVEVLILDEADEMLDMGFADDLEALLSATPPNRQTALFSATISAPIARIAKRHLREPHRVTIESEQQAGDGMARVRQVAYVVRRADKLAALGRILDIEDPTSTLVFARTRGEVDELAERLSARGHDVGALHGGLSQEQRDRVLGRFREGVLDLLVATDVAARGLDIERVSHVVNYDVPSNPDAYVHRIGRTGRAGREGVAITLVEPREHRLLANIERTVRARLELGRIPTVADLRERRLELLRANLRETILEDGLDRFRAVVEPLAEEFDVIDVALAAISLSERSLGRDASEEPDIAAVSLAERTTPRSKRPARTPRPGTRKGGPGAGESVDGPWTRIFVGGGRRTGIRPADLVGAITGEAGLPGSSVGAIQLADSHAIVEVPEGSAEAVVQALGSARIKGRRLEVRRDRGRGDSRPRRSSARG